MDEPSSTPAGEPRAPRPQISTWWANRRAAVARRPISHTILYAVLAIVLVSIGVGIVRDLTKPDQPPTASLQACKVATGTTWADVELAPTNDADYSVDVTVRFTSSRGDPVTVSRRIFLPRGTERGLGIDSGLSRKDSGPVRCDLTYSTQHR